MTGWYQCPPSSHQTGTHSPATSGGGGGGTDTDPTQNLIHIHRHKLGQLDLQVTGWVRHVPPSSHQTGMHPPAVTRAQTQGRQIIHQVILGTNQARYLQVTGGWVPHVPPSSHQTGTHSPAAMRAPPPDTTHIDYILRHIHTLGQLDPQVTDWVPHVPPSSHQTSMQSPAATGAQIRTRHTYILKTRVQLYPHRCLVGECHKQSIAVAA